ncbi:MAG: hypothetical protein JSV75_04790 [Candidatus Bathyarchaeota archaeon]|nr:MAG: hypothetical protein JSV75_04790 [Candidatus Bathyarchaeota archaeon]
MHPRNSTCKYCKNEIKTSTLIELNDGSAACHSCIRKLMAWHSEICLFCKEPIDTQSGEQLLIDKCRDLEGIWVCHKRCVDALKEKSLRAHLFLFGFASLVVSFVVGLATRNPVWMVALFLLGASILIPLLSSPNFGLVGKRKREQTLWKVSQEKRSLEQLEKEKIEAQKKNRQYA